MKEIFCDERLWVSKKAKAKKKSLKFYDDSYGFIVECCGNREESVEKGEVRENLIIISGKCRRRDLFTVIVLLLPWKKKVWETFRKALLFDFQLAQIDIN